MKNLFRWIISNTPAMNIVMIVVLGVGTYAALSLQRESFPNFDVETIMVQVPYPGATPEEVCLQSFPATGSFPMSQLFA